ncbi:hypothetical protein, partial [Alkalibacterium indicireducens]|uniref:hypothetical protein n=1 Tax=Alkalibacterium indicireducens TaxID=398758 RepID=UPI0031F99FE6
TVPTAKSVVDFHHQVVAHAGRTKKTPDDPFQSSDVLLIVFILLFCDKVVYCVTIGCLRNDWAPLPISAPIY